MNCVSKEVERAELGLKGEQQKFARLREHRQAGETHSSNKQLGLLSSTPPPAPSGSFVNLSCFLGCRALGRLCPQLCPHSSPLLSEPTFS